MRCVDEPEITTSNRVMAAEGQLPWSATYGPMRSASERDHIQNVQLSFAGTECSHCPRCQVDAPVPSQFNSVPLNDPPAVLRDKYEPIRASMLARPSGWPGKSSKLVERCANALSWKTKSKNKPHRPPRPRYDQRPGWRTPTTNSRPELAKFPLPPLEIDRMTPGWISHHPTDDNGYNLPPYRSLGEIQEANMRQMQNTHREVGTDYLPEQMMRQTPIPNIANTIYAQANSHSTTTVTASQLQLKPSPLRPLKHPTFDTPYIPTMLHADASPKSRLCHTPNDRLAVPSHDRYDSDCRKRMRSSIYSSTSSTSTIGPSDTPLSTPPPIPDRHPSHCYRSEAIGDAFEQHASTQNYESGIIYQDRNFNDLPNNRNANPTPDVPLLNLSFKKSRTRRRLEKERAQKRAEAKLTGTDSGLTPSPTTSSVSSFGELAMNFLDHTEKERPELTPPTKSSLKAVTHEQDLPLRYAFDSEESLASATDDSPTLGRTQAEEANAKTKTVPVNDYVTLPQTSLVEVRNRLHRLLRDDEAEEAMFNGEERTPICTQDEDERHEMESSGMNPSTLQRVEIEHNGKRYPVLIGDGAKVYETPCQFKGCCLHGQKTNNVQTSGWI